MSSMSHKSEYRRDVLGSIGVWLGVFALATMVSWFIAAIWMSDYKHDVYGTVETPAGTFPNSAMESGEIPDYEDMTRDCGYVLSYGTEGPGPNWYPKDIREGCKQVMIQENSENYDDLRGRLKHYGFIE